VNDLVNVPEDDDEQRSSERFPLVTFCWYKRIDDAAEDTEEAMGKLCDVSEGGVGLLSTKAAPVGARLLLEIVSKAGRVSLLGTVTYCVATGNRGGLRIGVKINTVPPNDRANWRKIVDS
jgi:PilZ domain